MALGDKPELAWRVIAARVLLGWDQREFKQALDEKKLAAYHATNLEGKRADHFWFNKLGPRERETVAELLRVPIEWLEGPVKPIQTLSVAGTVPTEPRLDQIEEALEQLRQDVARLSAGQNAAL